MDVELHRVLAGIGLRSGEDQNQSLVQRLVGAAQNGVEERAGAGSIHRAAGQRRRDGKGIGAAHAHHGHAAAAGRSGDGGYGIGGHRESVRVGAPALEQIRTAAGG